MKIGIEAQRIFRKKKHGMDMVALELIRNLQLIDHENEYVVFVAPDEDDQVIQETPNFKIVKLDGGFYPLWEQITHSVNFFSTYHYAKVLAYQCWRPWVVVLR